MSEELKTPEQLQQESYKAAYDTVKEHWVQKIQPQLAKPEMDWVYLSSPWCVSSDHMATFARENGFDVRIQCESGPRGVYYEARVPPPLLSNLNDY